MEAGYISDEQRSSRLITGGEITALTAAFKLKDGKPFSVFVKPGSGTDTTILLTVKLPGNNAAVPMPFKTEQWNELLVEEITTAAANVTILAGYDLYWATGDNAEVDS